MNGFGLVYTITFLVCCIPPVIAFIRRLKKRFLILALSIVATMLLLANTFFIAPNICPDTGFTLWLILMIWSMTKKNKLTLRMVGWFLFGMSIYFSLEGYESFYHAGPDPVVFVFCIATYALAFITGLIFILIPQKKNQLYLLELDKLFDLKQKGAITDEEYEAKKQELLNS